MTASTTPLSTGLPTVLVLASGRGERFLASGGTTHKLRALLAGKPVLEHVLDAVRASGLPWHLEGAGHPGMGDSIAAAVRATQGAIGWLILPGDLPLIRAETLGALASALVDMPGRMPATTPTETPTEIAAERRPYQAVIPVYNGQRGHPVGFSAVCRDSLLALKGNKGAASVLIKYFAIETVVNDIGCITDIDTLEDLQRAQTLIDNRL